MQEKKNIILKHKGLSSKEAESSKKRFGTNTITHGKRKTFLRKYLESFGDPTIKILLIALALNVIFFIKNFNWYESIGIAVSIMLATLISSLSEYGSQLAFEKLMEEASRITCRVWRDSTLTELPTSDIVVGDYVQLEPGDKIPADGMLINGALEVDQSVLNGETKEAHKLPVTDPLREAAYTSDFMDPYKLFSGSVVCEGEGLMLVESVGDNSYYGKLARELQEDKQDSPLKRRLADLARTISRFGYLGAFLVIVATLFNSILLQNSFDPVQIATHIANPHMLIGDILKAVTLGITVIVVAVPEGLPVMITVVLSSNMKRMIKDNVLVRKLVGIETAGSLNILFTDKTGTLTKGKLKVKAFITGDDTVYKSTKDLSDTPLWKLIYISSVYNNGSKMGQAGKSKTPVGGNSTDRALLSFAEKSPVDTHNIYKVSGIPFTSRNKYSTAVTEGDLKLNLIKGAPEKILPRCRGYYTKEGLIAPLTNRNALAKHIKSMSSDGIRLLALAVASQEILKDGPLPELNLIGIACIRDELRPFIRSSIAQVHSAGIQVVMITGDLKDTATAIAKEAGLIGPEDKDAVITSDELNALRDDQIRELLPRLRVVARALPSDKSRLVRISQTSGLVVGMTGDGVNDAPALKKADVGFSMGSGTEITKEASDIVILDDDFASISKAILYGRTIFKSIRKFIIFQLSINVCAVGISIIGQFIGVETPITVIQMLWVNMVMDTLAGLAFAGEAPLPEYMEEPPKKKNEKIINHYMANQIFFTGLYTTILCILFLKLPQVNNFFRHTADERYMMTGFFAFFMFAAIFNSLNSRTQRLNLLAHILKNKAFVIIMTLICAIQIFLLYHGGSVFRLYRLTSTEFCVVLSLSFTVIPFDLMRKSYLRMKYDKEDVAKFL